MARDDPEIRPQTQALDALIRRTIAQVLRGAGAKPADAMLFLGNWHHAFPALLVQDPVLEPVDKIVWMVVCQHGQSPGTGTAFPGYDTIARQANIASTSTVSRAIAILRLTRWLSLCARVRDRGGRFRGKVYALHDEPLPLADALHLDPDYMSFVHAARRHHHARVRKVAEAVLASLDEDIAAGVDVLAPVNHSARRLEAVEAVRQASPRRYFSFSATVVARLANRAADTQPDRDQISKPATRLRISNPQNSKAVSSSCINIKTTTTQKNPREANDDDRASLIYPSRLSANQRAIAARYLATVPAEHRQAVLDELEGRLRAETQGARPVYDELRYLHHLCRQASTGGFEPNLSLKVQDARERRAEALAQRQQEARAREMERPRPSPRPRRHSGESPLAEAHRLLGMPPFDPTKRGPRD